MGCGYTIEVETLITIEMYKSFCLFSLFRSNNYKEKILMWYLRSTCLLIVLFFWAIRLGFNWFNSSLIMLLLLFTSFLTNLVFSGPRKSYKAAMEIFKCPIKYVFDHENLTIHFSGEPEKNLIKLGYEDMAVVYVLEDVIYLYIDKSQGFIVNRKNIDSRGMEFIRNRLKNSISTSV